MNQHCVKVLTLIVLTFLPQFCACAQNAGTSSLHEAATKGDIARVTKLLDSGAQVDAIDHGKTALHVAAAAGHDEIVKLLLDRGANVNAKDSDGHTPLEVMQEAAKRLWDSGQPITPSLMKVAELLAARGGELGGRKPRDTMLHRYAIGYSKEQAENAIKQGANVNGRDEDGRTPLHQAAFAGTIDRIELFLKYGADANARDQLGRTPLELAATSGHVEAVKLLLEHGADLHAKGKTTPLYEAAQGAGLFGEMGKIQAFAGMMKTADHRSVCELLIQRGADVNERCNQGEAPLHAAARSGSREIAEVLLARGADINLKDDAGETPLHIVLDGQRYYDPGTREGAGTAGSEHDADRQRYAELIIWLKNRGARDEPSGTKAVKLQQIKNNEQPCDPDSILEADSPPLFGARTAEDVERILKAGADIGARNHLQETPLHWAAETGRVEVVKALLKRGANIKAQDGVGRTPLHTASQSGDVQIASLLLEAGADVSATDAERQTPLHAISGWMSINGTEELHSKRHPEFVATASLLLDRGARIDAKDQSGKTPLHWAVQNGEADLVKLFLSRGANVNETDEHGSTLLHAAAQGKEFRMLAAFDGAEKSRNFGDIAELLIARGIKADSTDGGGVTPLHVAAVFCDLDVARVLLKHGANVNPVDQHGESPLNSAERGQEGLRIMGSPNGAESKEVQAKCYDDMIALLRSHGAK
ncbi:MAG: ankyrin repeat domain-containing protein [Planctomycetes bacterium]|nr:ankyrin repeat domain-containing protein [Planctomycetota bacterium]